jgi:multicomponent Na+:H+ antiporter subunit E
VRRRRVLFLFLLLLGFWLLLSGRSDVHLVLSGVLSALIVTAASIPLLERTLGPADAHGRLRPWRWLPFSWWLLGRMARSAVQLARIVLDPRLPPEPGIVRFRTELATPAARMMMSTSITLVPGTMTLDVKGDEFTVHSFTPDAVEDFASGELQNRIAGVFGEGPQQAPRLLWDAGHTRSGQVLLEEEPPFPEGPEDAADAERSDAAEDGEGPT